MDEQPNLDYFNQIADGDEQIITTLTSILKNEFPEVDAIIEALPPSSIVFFSI